MEVAKMEYKKLMRYSFDLWQAFKSDMPECKSCAKTIAEWSADKDLTKREIHDIHEIAFLLLTTEGRASIKASVLAWLFSGQEIDDITAAVKLECRNLSSMISKLRNEGWAIGKERRKTPAGQMSTYYYLAEVR